MNKNVDSHVPSIILAVSSRSPPAARMSQSCTIEVMVVATLT